MKKLVTAVMSCAVAFAACAGMSVSAEKADTYSAWLVGTIGGNQIWEKADAQVTSITGNGSYTVNWKLDQGSDSVSCLILKTDINLYDYAPEDVTAEKLLDESSAKIVIDSVSVDGAPISYKMSDGAFTVDDDGSTIRVNLMNEWGQKVNIYDVPAKTNIAESISVSFTVSGLDQDADKDDSKGDDTKQDDTKQDNTKTDNTKKDNTKTDNTKKDDTKKDAAKTGDAGVGLALAGLTIAGAAAFVTKKRK
ncbi:LPXTG cell wall anchor domain-containing protein [Ruminococcus champanellensis]|uniref:LPXTG cell wall anchor domain-containing protein n=1 Tax=Ruminococcus champanellensis TaxID=1161942 RepID=UPI0039F4D3A7